jgi:hypothetical protein
MIVMAQMILGRFGYGTRFTGVLDVQTQTALRSYQANRGISISGSLDALTVYALTNDDKVADKHFIDFGNYWFGWDDHYFLSTGAWDRMNSSEKSIRSSKLQCFRDKGLCIETYALEAEILGMPTIAVSSAEFHVTRWDEYEVIAEDTSPDCERDELRINRQGKTVSLISTPAYKVDSCKQYLGQPETVTYRLVDGTKIFQARSEANAKRKASLYQFSPTARAVMDGRN